MRIITDSTADLSPDLCERFGVQVVPLVVTHAGEVYHDGVDMSAHYLFDLVDATGELPKTAAPSVAEYAAAFAGDEPCLYIGISSRLSGSVQNATIAAQGLEPGRVTVIDSLNLSTGIGHLVLRAAELRDAGASRDDVARAVQALVPKVHTSFFIETFRYLYMGGRCTALQSIVGSLLKIRPVVAVGEDGVLGVREKVRGTRKRALDTLLEDLYAHQEQLDRHRIFVTHARCEADAVYLADEIRRQVNPGEVCITEAGCVISSHCGPDCLGILYLVQ